MKPNDLESRKTALIAEIHEAFATTKLGSGLSFAQAEMLDAYEPIESVRASRKAEPPHWSTLVDDPQWRPFTSGGGFVFIDVYGFRFYLPPTMIRMLKRNEEGFPGQLVGFIRQFLSHRTDELLSESQCHCVAKFMQLMSDLESESLRKWEVEHPWGAVPNEPDHWGMALDSIWSRYLPAP
jgi:hypothetical protein